MKVVFLDFDGVLNSGDFFKRNRGKGGGSMGEAGALDPAAVRRLNRLLERTGAVVVVSSSWRHGRSSKRLEALLRLRGFRGTVIDTTKDWSAVPTWDLVPGMERGDEIRLWLDEHPDVTSYVVLDDFGDMKAVRDRFVQTDMDAGLTDADVERAIALLAPRGKAQP